MKIKGIEIESFDLSRTELENIIDEWIYNERNRQILKRRFLDGLTYEQLAEEFDLSVQAIKKIIYKEQERLFCHMYPP